MKCKYWKEQTECQLNGDNCRAFHRTDENCNIIPAKGKKGKQTRNKMKIYWNKTLYGFVFGIWDTKHDKWFIRLGINTLEEEL